MLEKIALYTLSYIKNYHMQTPQVNLQMSKVHLYSQNCEITFYAQKINFENKSKFNAHSTHN